MRVKGVDLESLSWREDGRRKKQILELVGNWESVEFWENSHV